ncbi:DNA-3-methyladenine glycosylase, partial [Mycolicibacterium farcinogenes]|nr:DNA-3-methyladenine glycosylase [Mycolicibacterium farcinogenes]
AATGCPLAVRPTPARTTWVTAPLSHECGSSSITLEDNGIDLFAATSPIRLALSDPVPAIEGPRVGVSKAADRRWRLWLADRAEVSAYRRSPRAPAPGSSD